MKNYNYFTIQLIFAIIHNSTALFGTIHRLRCIIFLDL